MPHPTSFSSNNITLKKSGDIWWLEDKDSNGGIGNILAVTESEISDICDVCLEWLIHYAKPPKGMRKVIGKKLPQYKK